ncbi:MAG: hypothetical protein MHM6MM_000024 [Cercozoa sp. M6MM]
MLRVGVRTLLGRRLIAQVAGTPLFDFDSALKATVQVVKERGGELHDKVKVCDIDEVRGRGVVATETLPKDSLVVKLSDESFVTQAHAMEQSELAMQTLRRMAKVTGLQHEDMTIDESNEFAPVAVAAWFWQTLHDDADGDDDRKASLRKAIRTQWRAYFSMTPPHYRDLPLFWNGARRGAILRGSALWNKAGMNDLVLRLAYLQLRESIAELNEKRGRHIAMPTLGDFLHFVALFWTRSLNVRVPSRSDDDAHVGFDAMILPLVDMLNHAQNEACNCAIVVVDDGVEVRTTREVAPSEELCFDYGSDSNLHRLFFYGFADAQAADATSTEHELETELEVPELTPQAVAFLDRLRLGRAGEPRVAAVLDTTDPTDFAPRRISLRSVRVWGGGMLDNDALRTLLAHFFVHLREGEDDKEDVTQALHAVKSLLLQRVEQLEQNIDLLKQYIEGDTNNAIYDFVQSVPHAPPTDAQLRNVLSTLTDERLAATSTVGAVVHGLLLLSQTDSLEQLDAEQVPWMDFAIEKRWESKPNPKEQEDERRRFVDEHFELADHELRARLMRRHGVAVDEPAVPSDDNETSDATHASQSVPE